jgi:hypothetical protein
VHSDESESLENKAEDVLDILGGAAVDEEAAEPEGEELFGDNMET